MEIANLIWMGGMAAMAIVIERRAAALEKRLNQEPGKAGDSRDVASGKAKLELGDAQAHVAALGAGLVIAELAAPLFGRQTDLQVIGEVAFYGTATCLVLWLRARRSTEHELEDDASDNRSNGRADDRGGGA